MRWLKFTADGQTSWGIVENGRVIAVDKPGAEDATNSLSNTSTGILKK